MADTTLARRYATAVFSLARDQGVVDRVGADLREVRDLLAADPSAQRFFNAPVIERGEKSRVIMRTFGGRLHDISVHTLLLLVRKRREGLLPAIVDQYEDLQRAARGAAPLVITTAHELTPRQLAAMVERLSRVYNTKFDVTQRVEPALIGGVQITMGDRRIDGSVAGRLDELARSLFSRS